MSVPPPRYNSSETPSQSGMFGGGHYEGMHNDCRFLVGWRMTKREILFMFALSATIVWRILWDAAQSINPPDEPVAHITYRVPPPAVETLPIRVPKSIVEAPISAFSWVQPPVEKLLPTPQTNPAPRAPALPPGNPIIELPKWLFEPLPVVHSQPPSYTEEEPMDEESNYQTANVEEEEPFDAAEQEEQFDEAVQQPPMLNPLGLYVGSPPAYYPVVRLLVENQRPGGF
jgi:hypothetical protein